MDDGMRLFILTVAGMAGTGMILGACAKWRIESALRWMIYGSALLFPGALTIVAIAEVLSRR